MMPAVCSQAAHEAMKLDPIAWAALTFVGVQSFAAEDDEPASALEMRNCHCHSTLCKSVAP